MMRSLLFFRSLQKIASLAGLLALLVLSSCAKTIHFNTSTVVPTAEGTVKVKKDQNNNYALSIDITNLAEPERLPRARRVYVVWVDTKQNGEQNLGQLKTSKGLFSSTLKASMETTIPYKPTRLFITAEESSSITHPGDYVVLNTDAF